MPRGFLSSVKELAASLAERSCLLGTHPTVESVDGARESCCVEAKDACAGEEELLRVPCTKPGERDGTCARGASCDPAGSLDRK